MSYQTVQSYRLSRNLGEILRVAQNSVFKNHPRDILRDENHLYGIVPVHIIHKTALNTTKRLGVIHNFQHFRKRTERTLGGRG